MTWPICHAAAPRIYARTGRAGMAGHRKIDERFCKQKRRMATATMCRKCLDFSGASSDE